jgi:hypothetical protein
MKYYKFTLKMGIMNVLTVVLMLFAGVIVIACGYRFNMVFNSFNIMLLSMGSFLYLFIHEICHGLGYTMFAKNKKNIKYGIALEKGVFYAMCQEEISKKGIIISLLMPLIVLTIIALPIGIIFHIDWLVIYALVNFSGAIGDMTMTVLMLKCPSDVKYIDYDNTIGAYLLSKHDLSKIKSFGMKFEESGDAKSQKVNESIKFFTVSKGSLIYFIILLVITVLAYFVSRM